MVHISNLRYVCLEESGRVTVSFKAPEHPKVQMLLDARWMPEIEREIPNLQLAVLKNNMQEFHRRMRDLMSACEGY